MRFVVVILFGLAAPLAYGVPEPEHEKYAKSPKKMKLASRQICADLCTQGLGGPPCGDVCEYDLGHDFGVSVPDYQMPPRTKKIIGARKAVCPYLCQFELGDPLCDCDPLHIHHDKSTVDWHGVCDAFCHIEGLTIYGCPKCYQDPSKIPQVPLRPANAYKPPKKPDAETLINHGFKIVAAFDKDGKTLVSEEGANLLKDLSETHDITDMKMGANMDTLWKLSVPKVNMIHEETPIDWDRWCELKCYQGEGGAACNCDALP